MKNWLDNKQVLHEILNQGDLANTIHGGTSETTLTINKSEKEIQIIVSASGVHSSDFRVSTNQTKLIVSRHLNEAHNANKGNKFYMPIFLKEITLPITAIRDRIKAYYEDGLLRIVIPTEDAQNLNKEIEIQEF